MLDYWISFAEIIAILVMCVSIGIVFSCLAWVIIITCCDYYTPVWHEPLSEIRHSDHYFIRSALRRSRNLAIRRNRYSYQTTHPFDVSLKPTTIESGSDEAIQLEEVMDNRETNGNV